MSGVCHPGKGELVSGENVYYADDAGAYSSARDNDTFVLTRLHSFAEPKEVKRWREALQEENSNLRLQVSEREDCHPLEDRYLANVDGECHVPLPEPSRAVEFKDAYRTASRSTAAIIHKLQRAPEIAVWQLPSGCDLCAFAVCDGFMSKLALPTESRLVKCLSNPGAYLMADRFDGTVFEDCEVVDIDDDWQRMTLIEKIEFIREKCELPDDMWQEAHSGSCDKLLELAKANNGTFPSMKENPGCAVEATAHMAVMFLSDDNITATVSCLIPN